MNQTDARTAKIDAALKAEGLYRTTGSGWFCTVLVDGEAVKVWATDEKPEVTPTPAPKATTPDPEAVFEVATDAIVDAVALLRAAGLTRARALEVLKAAVDVVDELEIDRDPGDLDAEINALGDRLDPALARILGTSDPRALLR